MKYEAKTEIPARRIADMFVGCIEGNFMTRAWVESILVSDEQHEAFITSDKTPWYDNPAFFEQDFFEIEVIHDGKDSEEGAHDKTTNVTPALIAAGLVIMAERYPRHFANMVNQEDDNITQDVFLQCVVLGEVVFG